MGEYIYATNGNPVAMKNGEISLARDEIVRCKDCKHFCKESRDTSIGLADMFVCDSEQWSTASLMPSHKVKPDGFCAWGERRNHGYH